MSARQIVLIGCLLMPGCTGQNEGAPPAPALNVDRELAGIEETRNAFMAALKAGRPQDLGGLVTPDVRMVSPGAPEWDHMHSLADHRGMPFPYDSIEMRPIETVVVNDSIAWDFGTSSVYYTNEQGVVRQLQDTFLVILKKGDDGVWRLHREVASARVE